MDLPTKILESAKEISSFVVEHQFWSSKVSLQRLRMGEKNSVVRYSSNYTHWPLNQGDENLLFDCGIRYLLLQQTERLENVNCRNLIFCAEETHLD